MKQPKKNRKYFNQLEITLPCYLKAETRLMLLAVAGSVYFHLQLTKTHARF